MTKHSCIIAWHHGHSGYTLKEYKLSKQRDSLDCCGGTEMANFCYKCGKKIKSRREDDRP